MIAQHLVLGNESLESWPMESGLPNIYNTGGRTRRPSLCIKIKLETIFADLLRGKVRILYSRPYRTIRRTHSLVFANSLKHCSLG